MPAVLRMACRADRAARMRLAEYIRNGQEKRVGTIRLRPLAFSTGQTERSPRYLVLDVPLDGQSEGVLHLQRPSFIDGSSCQLHQGH